MPVNSKNTYEVLKWPVLAYSVLSAGYMLWIKGPSVWFSWHPFSMVIAFILLAINATLIKKLGGAVNTRMHGQLMIASFLIGLFGYYVIYTNKEMKGKPHLTSWHGKLGATVMIGYGLVGLFGGVALHPDWGMFKTNKTFRITHKYVARVLIALAWIDCVLGELTFQHCCCCNRCFCGICCC